MDNSVVQKMEDLLLNCEANMTAAAEAAAEAARKHMTANELMEHYSNSKSSTVIETTATVLLNKLKTRTEGHIIGRVRRLNTFDNGDHFKFS